MHQVRESRGYQQRRQWEQLGTMKVSMMKGRDKLWHMTAAESYMPVRSMLYQVTQIVLKKSQHFM